MGMFNGFLEVSIPYRIVFWLLLLASICTLISFTTTYWAFEDTVGELYYTNYGLWRGCDISDLPAQCVALDGAAKVWFGAVQALVTVGFIGVLVAFLLVTLYIFVGHCRAHKEMSVVIAITCIITGILYLSGCFVFVVKVYETWRDVGNFKLGYSFALSCAAIGLEFITVIVLLIEGLLYLAGCVVFAVKTNEKWTDGQFNFGYSFGLSIVAFGLEIISGIIMIIEAVLARNKDKVLPSPEPDNVDSNDTKRKKVKISSVSKL